MLTTVGVASILGVHPSTVRRWCREGTLRYHAEGPGSERRFRYEDVAIACLDRYFHQLLTGK